MGCRHRYQWTGKSYNRHHRYYTKRAQIATFWAIEIDINILQIACYDDSRRPLRHLRWRSSPRPQLALRRPFQIALTCCLRCD